MHDDTPDTVAAPGISASTEIGPEGGSLETENGARIEIPPGALTTSESITLYSYPSNEQLPGSWCPIPGIAGALRLEPHGLKFDAPVTITVPLDTHWTPGEKIPLYILDTDDSSSIWQPTGDNGTISSEGLKFTAEITHFSGYGGGSPEGFKNGDSLETFKSNFTRWYMDIFMQDLKIRCKNNNCYKLTGVYFELKYKLNSEEGTDFWKVDDPSGDPESPLIMIDYIYDISDGQSIDGFIQINTTNYYKCTKPMLIMRSDDSILKEGDSTKVYAEVACTGIPLEGKEISFNIKSGSGQVDSEIATTDDSGSASTTFSAGAETSVVSAYHNSCPGEPGEDIEGILTIATAPGSFNLAIFYTLTMSQQDPYINETVGYSGIVVLTRQGDNGDGTSNVSGSGKFPISGGGEYEYNEDENCTTEYTGEASFTFTGTLVTDSEGKQTLHLTQTTSCSESIKTITCPDTSPVTNPGLVLGGTAEFIFPVTNGYTVEQPFAYGPMTSLMTYILTF
jgi:hypothetical protein